MQNVNEVGLMLISALTEKFCCKEIVCYDHVLPEPCYCVETIDTAPRLCDRKQTNKNYFLFNGLHNDARVEGD
jgi:hypothetical protein